MKKDKPNVFIEKCPSRDVISRLSGKWSILILSLLKEKPLRFNEIKHQIQGISQKVLTENLRSLERDGLVNRRVFTQTPLKVEYNTTRNSNDLLTIIKSLTDWAEKNCKALELQNEIHDKK
ncbi:MAG: hypothetical protein CBD16_01860 [Betaproteobacteria bacterium TMED156]|nr:MAG: hypothetical protein CBD16_01860 [Betaproteobacteria bacterium TMED156]|tara:strand:+ start:76 stop:438 length:363 start_codon:yes stop_codon:yes gene_type:complete